MKGFTLPEVLLVMVVSVIVGGLLLTIIVNTTGLFLKQQSKVEQGLGVNDALNEIKQVIRQGQAIASSYSGDIIYTSSATQIVLKIPSYDASGNIISDTFDYFVFFADGQKKLRQKIFPAAASSRKSADQILASNVELVDFRYYDGTGNEVTPQTASKIKATLTLRQKVGPEFEVSTATAEANLRND